MQVELCMYDNTAQKMSRPSHNLSRNGRAATSRKTDVTNQDLGASRGAMRG